MKNTQLISFLKSLSFRELKRLEEMLQSSFFNKNERCLQLFLIIKSEMLENDHDLDRNWLRNQLFPEKKTKDSSFSLLLSYLLNFAQEVIIQEQLRLRPNTRDFLLANGLREKGAGAILQKLGEKSLRKLQAKKKKTKEDYQNHYLITNLLYEAQITTERSKHQDPEAVATALDAFYLSHRLPLTYEIMNVEQLMINDGHDQLGEKVVAISQNNAMDKLHLIQLYKQSVLLVLEPEFVENFEKLLTDLEAFAEFIPREELHSLYAVASNYCIQQIIKGKLRFNKSLFDIYQRMLDENVLFITKYIPAAQVKNVVSISCQLGKMEWAHDFLEEYGQFLAPKIRESNYKYYLATIYFYQKNFKRASSLLVMTDNLELFFEIGYKFLLLKCYYELQEGLALVSQLASFKSFIRNNKTLSAPVKASYLNFSKMLKLLEKNRLNGSPKKLALLKTSIGNYDYISDKKWLLEKLEEIG